MKFDFCVLQAVGTERVGDEVTKGDWVQTHHGALDLGLDVFCRGACATFTGSYRDVFVHLKGEFCSAGTSAKGTAQDATKLRVPPPDVIHLEVEKLADGTGPGVLTWRPVTYLKEWAHGVPETQDACFGDVCVDNPERNDKVRGVRKWEVTAGLTRFCFVVVDPPIVVTFDLLAATVGGGSVFFA